MTVVACALLAGLCLCSKDTEELDYREEMRTFVQNISSYARGISNGFLVIPQNGQELLTMDGESSGSLAPAYAGAIDGVGREDLFFGYDEDNVKTPDEETGYMIGFLECAQNVGIEVLVTDYCWTPEHVDSSYEWNAGVGYISFAADQRDLNSIPLYPVVPYNMHNNDVTTLSGACNFLYIINTGAYSSKEDFINALEQTDYDVLIIDLFYEGSDILSTQDVAYLKEKSNGGVRLVLAYCSIGEAENYRYYWSPSWDTDPPQWLAEENPRWPGNYKVRYWEPQWQEIIYGNDDSYIRKILDAGFDGVYLDIIDAFEFWEE
ncbi:endo alpha-1,4 polygalactosaminidase [candidate division WOR-3 bacterium]|nr:endo alpha-1,4 polygalactosaminidase [candidate division WOR-3 bacterium]